jgi:hypothetical protein
MARTREAPRTKSPKQPERDIFLTVLRAPDRESVARLLRTETLDVGLMRTRPDSPEVEVHIYADDARIKKLKKEGWKLEVHENLSEVGRKRQKEVGKGDRFKGGTIPPKGLGRKTGKED